MLFTRNDVYQSAITNEDGTVNVGYLVLFRSGRAVILVVAGLVVMGALSIWTKPENAATVIQSIGVAIGAVLGAYGLLLGGMSTFMWSDRANTAQAGATGAGTGSGAKGSG